MTILTVVLYEETFRPVLVKRKLARMRRELRDESLRLRDDERTPFTILNQALIRPFKLILFSPTVAIACLASGLMFFYFYLLIATFPRVFECQYGFNHTEVGLSYFGLGIGNLFGLVFFAATSDRYLARAAQRRAIRPEDQLAPIYLGSPIIGIAFLWYGWSANKQLHWIMPIIGTTFSGFGLGAYMMPIILYLTDSWKLFAASAVATNVFLRSVVGALLPLVAGKLWDRLRLGWGNSLLAFLGFLTTPLPWLYYKHGQYLRERFPVNL
jgi:Major Facilitator Superfamily